MKAKVWTAALSAVSAAAAGLVWTAPSAAAGTPYCDSLPPQQAHDCNCGFDFAPGSQEFHDCVYANAPTQRPGNH
jgi:hypothetical protein